MKTKTGIILLGQGEGIMKTKARVILLGLVMVIALCYANSVRAETGFDSGDAPAGLNASARLNFEIVIPRFVYFRVGGAGIDTVTFRPSAEEVAEGTPGISGDLGSGTVSVRLISNAGNLNISSTTNGTTGLTSGANDISYGQINTINSSGEIPVLALFDDDTDSQPITAISGIINLTDTWTYTYDNIDITTDDPPVAGIYSGQGTYTAATP